MYPDYASLVDVTGNALLASKLLVRVWPGYTPNPYYRYDILTVGGFLSGYFSNALDGQRINTVGGQGSFVVRYGSPGYEQVVALEDWGARAGELAPGGVGRARRRRLKPVEESRAASGRTSG